MQARPPSAAFSRPKGAEVFSTVSPFAMSLRKMAKPETESDEPLSEMEMRRCAGLLRRAVMHGQAHGLVKLVAGQVHGRPIAVTCGDVLEQIQAMNDSSKRRIEFSETEESESWDEVPAETFMDRLHGLQGRWTKPPPE